jgi:hypothetical protein
VVFPTVRLLSRKPLKGQGQIGAEPAKKGVCHRIATKPGESGAKTRDIADLPGQKTESMPRCYSRDAVIAGKNLQTFTCSEEREARVVRASKVAKSAGKSVKSAAETPWRFGFHSLSSRI